MNGENASSATRQRARRGRYSSTKPIGYSPRKRDVGEPCAVKRAHLVRLPALDPHGETLVERRLRSHRVGVMGLAGVIDPVENIPVPELAVATQVELPGADSADGHADQRQVGPR